MFRRLNLLASIRGVDPFSNCLARKPATIISRNLESTFVLLPSAAVLLFAFTLSWFNLYLSVE